MIQEFRNPFGRIFLTIEEDRRNRWIRVNWIGYLTAENVKTGAMAYTDALQKANLHCVLNDTRLIVGSWDHSLDWVVQEWAPGAAKAGLKHLAMVATPETFAESTASIFYARLTAFQTEIFEDMDKAKSWLRQHSLHLQGPPPGII